jgi:hypothetical protein
MDLKGKVRDGVEWIELVKFRVQWWSYGKAIVNLKVA